MFKLQINHDLKYNKYDYGIFFIIILLIFGNLGGSLQPIRVFVLLLSPLVWVNIKFWNTKDKRIEFVSYFFVFWIIYAILSLIWTSNRVEGGKEILYYYTHTSLFLMLLIWAKKARLSKFSIINGWCLLIVCTFPIALNELINNQHLITNIIDSESLKYFGGDLVVQMKFASVTFGNKNGYVLVLVYALPFLFSKLLSDAGLKHQLLFWLLILICFYILFVNASRGGIIASIISLIVFLLYYMKIENKHKKAIIISVLTFTLIIILYFSRQIFQQIILRLSIGSIISDENRTELIISAFSLFVNSMFIGTGIGSIQTSMHSISAVNEITHNLFLEILVQYGIIIFMLFAFSLFRLFSYARKSSSIITKQITYSLLFSLPISSVIDSGYLLNPVLWVMFASIFIITSNNT